MTGEPLVDDGDPLVRLKAGQTITGGELEVLATDRFGSITVGLVWDTVALDRITAHLDVDDRHLQPFGLVHGGVWCTLIESMASVGGALQVAGSGRQVVGVSNTTDFLKSHREGRVDAVATPVHVGRLQQLWLVEVSRADDGALLARGQVRLHNLDPDDRA